MAQRHHHNNAEHYMLLFATKHSDEYQNKDQGRVQKETSGLSLSFDILFNTLTRNLQTIKNSVDP